MLETEYNEEEVLKIVAEDAERRGKELGENRGAEKLAALLKMLPPGSEDYNKALNASAEERRELYKKYGIV